jgi:hypothetical protein
VHRHLFIATGAREFGVVVTIEARIIILRQRGDGGEAKDYGRDGQATPAMYAQAEPGIGGEL